MQIAPRGQVNLSECRRDVFEMSLLQEAGSDTMNIRTLWTYILSHIENLKQQRPKGAEGHHGTIHVPIDC